MTFEVLRPRDGPKLDAVADKAAATILPAPPTKVSPTLGSCWPSSVPVFKACWNKDAIVPRCTCKLLTRGACSHHRINSLVMGAVRECGGCKVDWAPLEMPAYLTCMRSSLLTGA